MNQVNRFLVVVLPVFFLSTWLDSQSKADIETSGGGIVKAFQALSAQEAFNSKDYFKRYQTIYLPNALKDYRGIKLCVEDNEVVALEPVEFCSQWAVPVRKPENGKSILVYKYRHQAMAKSMTDNGKNELRCLNKIVDHPAVPVQENLEDCVQWSVTNFNESRPQVFDTLKQAEFYVRENKNRTWSPKCSVWGVKTQVIPTTFRVDFYKDEFKVGSKNFKVPKCGSF